MNIPSLKTLQKISTVTPESAKQLRAVLIAKNRATVCGAINSGLRLVNPAPLRGFDERRTKMRELKCDMRRECKQTVTHIGSDGYAYCKEHAIDRRSSGYERTRQMTPAELRTLQSGQPLSKY